MNRQQRWAHGAHAKVKAAHNTDQEAKYRTFAFKFPSLLIQSGSAQAIAFLASRTEPGPSFLNDLAVVAGFSDGTKLGEHARTAEFQDYLKLSRDLLDVGTWFRRFAQAELKGEDNE